MTTAYAPSNTSCVLGCRSAAGKPFAAQQGYLTCDTCADELRGTLREIVELYALVDDQLLPAATGSATRGSPGYGSRSPLRDGLLAFTDARTTVVQDGDPLPVLEILSSWADNVRDDVGMTPSASDDVLNDARRMIGWLGWAAVQPWASSLQQTIGQLRADLIVTLGLEERTVAGEVGLLISWLDHVTRQYWVSDLSDEVTDLRNQLRAVLGQSERSIPVGECPAEVGEPPARERRCGAQLRARLGSDRIVCRACGTSWPRDRWDELSGALGTPLSDMASLSVWLDVPTGTLRRWRGEDAWTPHGSRRRPLYARAEALKSWQRRRASAGSA